MGGAKRAIEFQQQPERLFGDSMPTTDWSMNEVEFLDVPTFLRKFEQRASGLMWLLGAGASRASGIKTAGDMIWDFKSRLYRSDRKIPASAVSDLGDIQIRRLLQNFFDASATYPPLDAEQEYAHYFEATYPAAQDRRRYIDDMMRGAKPGYGHMALARSGDQCHDHPTLWAGAFPGAGRANRSWLGCGCTHLVTAPDPVRTPS